MHDRYLRDFFERKRVHDHLVKQGLITDDNYVIENVKLMNEYRTYLFRTVYNDRITVELADQVKYIVKYFSLLVQETLINLLY